MPKHRLIATLLVHQGKVVQTRKFKPTNVVGSPFTAVEFFNTWAIDEILIVEISPTKDYLELFVEILEELSRRCFVPLTVGGKIENLDLVHRYTRAGADKVIVNTHALENPGLIGDIGASFGSQCVVVSIDSRPNREMPSGYEAVGNRGTEPSGRDALDWAREATDAGAGEILVNSVEFDGDKRGYDLGLIRLMSENLSVPIIAMGGVGEWSHLVEGITEGRADAVAAGNIFHYTEHSTKIAKEYMIEAGQNVRVPVFHTIDMPRLPKYRPY